jgi:hypothetical protein
MALIIQDAICACKNTIKPHKSSLYPTDEYLQGIWKYNLYFHTHKFSALRKIQYIDKYAELPAFPSVKNTSPFP